MIRGQGITKQQIYGHASKKTEDLLQQSLEVMFLEEKKTYCCALSANHNTKAAQIVKN